MSKTDYRVPVPEDVKATMNELGRRIGWALPPSWGFMLFEYGHGGSLTYISSAQREDMLNVLQEFMRSQAS